MCRPTINKSFALVAKKGLMSTCNVVNKGYKYKQASGKPTL